MFERFTERARQVVVLAQDEARPLGHNYLGTEHLLLGLLGEKEGVGARVLESLDVTLEEARARVVRIVGQGHEDVTGQIPFTPRAKKVLERALREAQVFGHNYIGTDHLLLALAHEDESVGARVLLDFGADAEKIRDGVVSILSSPTQAPPAPFETPTAELRLRRVVPIAHEFPDGTWLVSVEVWDHGVVVRYGQPQPPHRSPPSRHEWHGWLISDDAETNYARVGAGGGGNPQHGYHGDATFEPAPPPEATLLHVRRETTDEVISVSLTD